MAAVFPALAACQENAPAGPIVDPRPRARAPDAARLPARGHGRRRARGPRWAHGGGHGARPLRGVDRAVGAGPRDPERQALHLPRRRPARGAPHPRRAAAPRPAPRTPRRSAGSTPTPSTGCAAEAAPDVRGPEELHDLLLSRGRGPAHGRATQPWFDALADTGRAMRGGDPDGDGRDAVVCASSVATGCEALFPGAPFDPADAVIRPRTAEVRAEPPDADVVAGEACAATSR